MRLALTADLSPNLKLLLIAIASHCSEAGGEHWCFPGAARLAWLTGLSRSSVKRGLGDLYDLGIVRPDPLPGKPIKGAPKGYRVVPDLFPQRRDWQDAKPEFLREYKHGKGGSQGTPKHVARAHQLGVHGETIGGSLPAKLGVHGGKNGGSHRHGEEDQDLRKARSEEFLSEADPPRARVENNRAGARDAECFSRLIEILRKVKPKIATEIEQMREVNPQRAEEWLREHAELDGFTRAAGFSMPARGPLVDPSGTRGLKRVNGTAALK